MHQAYSGGAGDRQNRAAQVADPQVLQGKVKKRVDENDIAKLVAEENENRKKFPNYPGLDRWVLVEKMGDGAFSNVYKARDSHGELGDVAIKVVRKYEMNSAQVSEELCSR